MTTNDYLDGLDIKKDLRRIRKEKVKRMLHRNDPQDLTWWPIFWKKRFQPEVDAGKIPAQSASVLDFASQNYPTELPYTVGVICFDFYKGFEGKIKLPDDSFDAIVSHGNLNKDPRMNPGSLSRKNVELVMTKRVRKRIAEGRMTKEAYEDRLFSEMEGKAWCIMGGSHVLGVPWLVRDKVIERWKELYRVSKDGAVWFITCKRHGRFCEWAEEILTDEDRGGKKIHIVNF